MSAEEREDTLRGLVGLREHRGAGLGQDLVPGELDHFLRHVGVADAALRGGQVLDRDVEVVDGVVEPVLDGTQVGASGRHRLDRGVDRLDRVGGTVDLDGGGFVAGLGALQNRFEHTINNLNVSVKNLSASESRIRDADMAQEMMQFTRNQILSQAGTAMLAQANQAPQQVLQLLR